MPTNSNRQYGSARVLLTTDAMATRFELLMYGTDATRLRSAGEEALEEIERLERQLSVYQIESELSGVNANAAKNPVSVSVGLFRLLERAQSLWHITGGAFDITVAPLLQCWDFMGGTGTMPTDAAVAEARDRVGMPHIILDASQFAVSFDRGGMMLDLGAIGKGYAIEKAVEILRENGVVSALLHGGTSTVYGLGSPPDAPAWTIAIQSPNLSGDQLAAEQHTEDPKNKVWNEPENTTYGHPLAHVELRDSALSVSAPHGKAFFSGGVRYGHVLDPREGYPASSSSLLSAVVSASATDSDALSTALLLEGAGGLSRIAARYEGFHGLVASEDEKGEMRVDKFDLWERQSHTRSTGSKQD